MKKTKTIKKVVSAKQQKDLLATLAARFEKNTKRHKGVSWSEVEKKLLTSPEKIWSLLQMEETGGEPDVVVLDKKDKHFVFVDCAAESPKGRRSFCFDNAALVSRKEHKPENSAVAAAEAMDTDILTEAQYRALQKLGDFDLKTSSWVATPESIRKLGGALFCDKRYETVFLYHNGAESYYAGRAFRVVLSV